MTRDHCRVRSLPRRSADSTMPEGITFQIEVEPAPGRGDSGQLDVDLQDVLGELGETAREAG